MAPVAFVVTQKNYQEAADFFSVNCADEHWNTAVIKLTWRWYQELYITRRVPCFLVNNPRKCVRIAGVDCKNRWTLDRWKLTFQVSRLLMSALSLVLGEKCYIMSFLCLLLGIFSFAQSFHLLSTSMQECYCSFYLFIYLLFHGVTWWSGCLFFIQCAGGCFKFRKVLLRTVWVVFSGISFFTGLNG